MMSRRKTETLFPILSGFNSSSLNAANSGDWSGDWANLVGWDDMWSKGKSRDRDSGGLDLGGVMVSVKFS